VSVIPIQINDLTVSGKAGTTILELATGMGIHIPTLCHDPHLSPAGACRICLVEDVSRGVLLPACVTAIAPGMVIQTESPQVIENRRTILQLLLADHAESCIVCDKGNRCHLRSLAAELGIGLIPLDPMPQSFPFHDFNPFFKRDMSKCILCGKCIRADQELVVERVLDYSHRGFPARPATFQNRPLEEAGCTFCGTCLSMCPTGALIETGLHHQGSLSQSSASVCPHCACGCSLSLETCSNHIIRALPQPVASARGKALCLKGHFGFRFLHHPERLRHPLIRKDGILTAVTWEEALSHLINRFQAITQDSGGKALGCLAGPQLSNEELYLFQKLARLGFKTPNLDNGSSLYAAPTLTALHQVMGLSGLFRPLENILQADVLLVIGGNPTETAPVVGYMVKRAVTQKQAKLILIDPRRTKLTSLATHWISPRPGSDSALIHVLIKTIMDENLWNQGFVQAQTEGFLEWRESFFKLDHQSGLTATGLSEASLREAARTLASAQTIALIVGDGISQQLNATAALAALFNLFLLLGHGGDSGSGIYPLLKENNALGAWEMGVLPHFFPGFEPVSDKQAHRKWETRWEEGLPEGPGLSALEMLAAARNGSLKGLYLASEDPLGSYPDRTWVEEALESLEFLVVQDLFLTPTAQKAHLVLPSAGPAEKEGTYTNLERRIQQGHQAVSPPGAAKADGEIFASLLKSLRPLERQKGLPDSLAWPDLFPETVAEIREMVPGYDRITLTGLDQGPLYLTSSAKLKPPSFIIPRIHLDKASQDPAYPLILITGGILPHLGSGTRTGKDPRLTAITPPAELTVSPEDAEILLIQKGERVRIESRKGSLSVTARISADVPKGTVFLPLPYPDLEINRLFETFWEPLSKGSLHKHCPVRLIKE